MKKHIRLFVSSMLIIVGALSMLTVGCATVNDPVPRLVVKAQNENAYLVDGRMVDLDALASELKRAGAVAETEIIVELPVGATPASMRLVYPKLHSAGYQKIFLSHPREAMSTVITTTPAKPAAATAPAPATPRAKTLSPSGPKRVK